MGKKKKSYCKVSTSRDGFVCAAAEAHVDLRDVSQGRPAGGGWPSLSPLLLLLPAKLSTPVVKRKNGKKQKANNQQQARQKIQEEQGKNHSSALDLNSRNPCKNHTYNKDYLVPD